MEKLLGMRGGEVVQNGKCKGTKYRDLDEAAVNRLAKKSPGEPELGKYCRTLLALIEYESDEREKENTSVPKAKVTAAAAPAEPGEELALGTGRMIFYPRGWWSESQCRVPKQKNTYIWPTTKL